MVWFLASKVQSAIKENDVKRLSQLIDAGAKLEMDVDSGKTMLGFAVYRTQPAVVDFLLQKGAVVDAPNDSKWTPMHRAAYNGQIEIVAKLLKAGGDPNLRTSDGRTVHAIAVKGGHLEMAEMVKPFMKKAAQLFDVPAPPGSVAAPEAEPAKEQEPVQPSAPPESWLLLGEAQVARTLSHQQLGYRLTDVFDFRARERTRIINNTETKHDQVETTAFDSIADKGLLEDALKALGALGGKADAGALHGSLQKTAKLPPPQGM